MLGRVHLERSDKMEIWALSDKLCYRQTVKYLLFLRTPLIM